LARYVVAKVEEIPPGERRIFAVADRSVGIFNLGGEFFALRNRCPHQQGPVCEGRISGFLQSTTPGEYLYSRKGEILRCPWHGWEFDIRNGQSWYDPVRPRVRRYEVLVAEGSTLVAEAPTEAPAESDPDAPVPGLVKGPYVAETYEVSTDGQYVVVEIPDGA
jgi:nitrite reductase/ring-hydroxylating ferredoxin subunit